MKRFYHEQKNHFYPTCILSLMTGVCIILCLVFFLDETSAKIREKEKQILSDAISQSLTYCYSVEGRYPSDIAYLKEHYGITYRFDKFFVDYQPLGDNLMPDVTVIAKEDTSHVVFP